MKRVCVFCGSAAGHSPRHAETARELGQGLARRGWGLVFGGGRVGLMGEVADACLARGGEVIGVIPAAIRDLEVAHEGLDDLRVVGSMHERKQLMHSLASGFVVLPGGHGTLDELFESMTWLQLGYHRKPIVLCDPQGYYAPLLAMLDRAAAEGFLRAESRALWQVEATVDGALRRLEDWDPPDSERWLGQGDV